MQYSQEHLKTMVYAEFGGQTECIMGNWKIENSYSCFLPIWSGFAFLGHYYSPGNRWFNELRSLTRRSRHSLPRANIVHDFKRRTLDHLLILLWRKNKFNFVPEVDNETYEQCIS